MIRTKKSAKIGVICGWILLTLFSADAAQTRGELQFSLNAALLSNDRKAFARCFNFAGTDDATQRSFVKIIDQIFAWPTHHVFTSERSERGDAKLEQGGRPYRLNGEWVFQVHIFLSQKTSKGFVFPAGMVKDQCMILIAIPDAS